MLDYFALLSRPPGDSMQLTGGIADREMDRSVGLLHRAFDTGGCAFRIGAEWMPAARTGSYG